PFSRRSQNLFRCVGERLRENRESLTKAFLAALATRNSCCSAAAASGSTTGCVMAATARHRNPTTGSTSGCPDRMRFTWWKRARDKVSAIYRLHVLRKDPYRGP